MSNDNPFFSLVPDAPSGANTPDSDGNPFLPLVDAEVKQRREKANTVLELVLPRNPDKEAEAKRLGATFGLDADTVSRNHDELARIARVRDIQRMTAASPVLARQLANPDFAALAHDNVENMVAVERTFLGNITEPVQRGLAQGRRGLTLLFDQMGIFKGLERQRAAAAAAHGISYDPSIELAVRLAQQQREVERYPVPDDIARGMQDISNAQTMGDAFTAIRTNPRAVLETTLQSLGASAPALVGAAGGSVFGPGGTATGAGLGSFAVEYSNTLQDVMAEKGVNGTDPMSIHAALNNPELMAAAREKALKRGIPVAIFGALTAGLAGKLLAGAKPTVGSVGARAAGELGLQAGGGAAGEAGAQLATGEYKPGDILMEAFAEMPTAIIEVPGNYRHAMENAQRAQKGAEFLDNLNKLVQADKLVARDPQTFEQFVAQAAEAGPVQQVFIDAQTLMQSGVAEQVAAVSPAVASQLATAAQTGGQIAIPVEEYAARIAPTEYAQSLLDHLKTEPEGFSRAEAQQFMQSHAEELKAEVERILAEKQVDDTFKASAEVVRNEIRTQLDTAARFTPQVNDAYSAMVSNFYAVTAAKLGTTPEELFKRYPLKIGAERIDGQQFDQGGTLADLRQQWTDAGLKGDVSEKDGIITLSRIVVPEGERGTGKGTAAMQALVEYADRTGQHVALSPSADFGGNKKRLVQFYKRFGFVENKGKNRAFTTSESMYRQAQGKVLHQEARGAFNPASLSITLLKGADLSTFLHESGHFFLEVQTDIAAKLQQEAEIFGMDTLKPGERQILADNDALLRWFGIENLAEWYNLDFEQKRSYHEQFARGFEAYLFEGKAPSIELQGLFQRFRAWLLSVYRELKALNVELTDEVRGVFDRLLATNEQITLAEQGRSMMPLFTSPEQAGMTPEEFAAYQALGVDATAEAIEDLQARGLRDMRWLHNARGRIIKQLQKDAEAQRAQVRMDVRREVMSQPIYRAWQFLTGKLTADDKIAPPAKRTSSPDSIDETQDSLFVAIAKLGGLNRAAVQSEWGIDPKERIPMPAFGKHVLRREGGLSIDAMGEALGQYGYLTLDEHGKHDLRQLEDKFFEELRGNTQYSIAYDYAADMETRAGDQVVNPQALGAGRFDTGELRAMGLPTEVINAVQARRMTAGNGLHPDIVAEMFGFTSGDELVRKLAEVKTPSAEIEALTDVRMLEQFGDLSSPEAIEKAADKAIHNDARARFVATEANALAKATGQRKVLASAAKEFARAMIARLKVRDIKPGQYANAEVRAAKAAEKASKAGDLATAAAEKRNQLIQNYATRAAYDAQEEVDKGLRYLKKFEGDIKGLDADYADQIGNLLERFDLRKGQSNKAVDKRTALAEWIKAQREAGLEPDIPPELENEAFRTSYKNLTVEEFRGLVDTVRQIEHLGRLKHKLLTAADQRAYEAVRDEIAGSIRENAQGRQADTRTPTTNMGRALQGLKRFWASHIKAATWARIMDGGKDGGPVWEYFVRSANECGDRETTMRAEATAKLSEILAPVFKLGRMGGKGQFFPSINRSLNREARLAIALNTGNAGNLQRLLGGEGWTMAQLTPVLQSLTAQEWAAVQAVWDHFESYRPQIAEKERRVYGKEPEWVEPRPFTIATADGSTVTLRGGYYPIKYDPAASQRAEEHADAESAKRQLQGAYTTATTRRSFTKARVEEVSGRPLLYTLAGMYSGVNDVIHDLAWHEWLIDVNRLLRSHTIDAAIREHYGPEVKQQFKTWVQDVAEGDKGAANAGEAALGRLRQGVSAAGLGFNVMSAAIQIIGFNQSIVRVGAPWIGRGIAKYLGNPLGLTRTVLEMSDFMANRARTRFRELNELRNQVQDQSAFNEFIGRYAYFMMMRVQQVVDVPTWWGAYEKAIAAGNEETRAVALADQAVIDAQGSGQTKDLSAIERGGPALRLFTVFYSFMNTALNLGVAQTMGANTPAKRAKLAVDYLMLYTVPAVLGYTLKAALTPGDSGDDDLEEIAKKLAAEQLSYLMGLMVVVREFGEVAKIATGNPSFGYQGPAGVRAISDAQKFGQQAMQGEFDDAFRKSAVNLIGDFTGLPAAQINRTITGTQALAEGKTENPAAVAFGFHEER
jgi:GNAT superfamily N-acetyltransferase